MKPRSRFLFYVLLLIVINLISVLISMFLWAILIGPTQPPYWSEVGVTGLITLGIMYRFHFAPIRELNRAILDWMKGNP